MITGILLAVPWPAGESAVEVFAWDQGRGDTGVLHAANRHDEAPAEWRRPGRKRRSPTSLPI
jgi:hypothetical protein